MSARDVAARPVAAAARARTWWFPALIGALALSITALPYLVGSLTGRGGWRFMGIAADVPDTAQYFAWMRAFARADGLLIANPLTPEPNRAAFFNLLWYTLGHIGRILHAEPAAVYQEFRWAAGAAFLAVLWWACGIFCAPGWERRLAWLLVTFGGGFGWLWVVLKYVAHRPVPPLDVYIAEPNTFLALIGFPHLLFAATLLLGIFALCARGHERGGWASFGGAAALGLLLGVTHAYDLIIVYAVLGLFALAVTIRHRAIPWRLVGGIAAISALSSPPALYFTYLTQRDPTWRGVLAQYGNAGIVTPSPPHLVMLLGPIFLIALLAVLLPSARRALGSGPDRDLIIVVWFVASFPLAYLPTAYQIKMLNGWQIPIGILAARVVMRTLVPHLPRLVGAFRRFPAQWSIEAIVCIAILLIAIPTNVYLLAWRGSELRRADIPYSLTTGDAEALRWIGEHAQDGDVVLATLNVGQYVAALSDGRPVLAHWAQTLGYYDKERDVSRFFGSDMTEVERRGLLRRWDVKYIVISRAAEGSVPTDLGAGLRLAQRFRSEQTTIYEVSPIGAGTHTPQREGVADVSTCC